jgi:predicted nuclease of predicted toxin-antitoxin system
MGLDRFANFISKSINNDGIEEISIENNMRKIVANHIIFDLNFLIYQEIVEIENEINDIIKVILCLPFATNKGDELEIMLKNIFMQPHWKLYYTGSDLENIFDGFNEDEIIAKFIGYITSKITSNVDISSEKNEGLSIIELVIYEKIINTMVNYVEKLHQTNFIQTLSIFYDGIPSISKVIEQRRRRIKNYLESNEKKILFKKYFDNLLPNNKNLFENLSKKYEGNTIKEPILFDYFKWIKCRFTIDKSIGPSSNFIKNLELYMNIKIRKNYPKIKLYINSAKENGEADLKIFKYISQEEINGDYCIHTTDSDFIHQILIQQSYFKIISKDINFTVIKYLKNANLIGYVQVLEANLIIKNLMDLYNNTNNIKTNNYKIIWDLCLIFYLFGNDHLPSSVEIGPELGLEFYIRNHYQSLGKNNIINLKKSYISIDLENLALYLEKIIQTNESNKTRIMLQRFFKINSQLITLFVDKLSYNFDEIQDFLNKFITFKALSLDQNKIEELDESDLRKKYLNQVNNDLRESYLDLSIFNLDANKQKLLLDSIDLITENLDWYENEFNGLILYNKPQNITTDSYQDLYNYIADKASNNLSKKYPKYYDHITIKQHLDIQKGLPNNYDQVQSNDYLKKMYHLGITQFGNMKEYHSNNLTWFKHYSVPSIENLIQFIKNIPDGVNQTKKWLSEIKEENVEPNKYLNSINHHLIITPFISKYTQSNQISNIVKQMKPIDNLWFESVDTFNYRNIDIKQFFDSWEDAMININLNTKTTKVNDQLIILNSEFINI